MKTTRLAIAVTLCLLLGNLVQANPAIDDMAQAAKNLLAALSPEQKARATFGLKDDERKNWHFIPKTRKGLTFKDMNSAQRRLGFALLSSGLSQRGFLKATTIMSLEQILLELEQGKGPNRDPEMYYVSIFGEPGAKETWGWRVEGHHLSLNFTVVDGKEVAATPSFFGTNPANVQSGPRAGLRVLAVEEDLARALVKSLNESQRSAALITNVAPKDVITSAERKVKALEPVGLSAAKMNAAQTAQLKQLIHEYVYRVRNEVADVDLKKIEKAGFKNILFAWAGGTEPGEGHYYRVQGPTFLLEYDNTQNNNNHIHAVWRDFENDFGDDILRRHYEQSHQ